MNIIHYILIHLIYFISKINYVLKSYKYNFNKLLKQNNLNILI